MAAKSARVRGSRIGKSSPCRVAGGAGNAIVNVPGVFAEAGVSEDLTQIMALRAQSVRTVDGEGGVGEKIGNDLTRRRRLTELIAAFQQMAVFRSMRAVYAGAAEFAV